MTKRTEGPWGADWSRVNGHIGISINGANGRQVATVYLDNYHCPNRPGGEINHPDNDESRGNAAFIVLACNCHDELVEACKMLIHFVPDGWPMPLGWIQVVAQAEQAIAKAEGVKEEGHDRR